MSRRRGFTFVEMLIVMVVIGVLTGIATLKFIDLRNHATATGILADLDALRLGAYNYWADHNVFPPDAGAGATPLGMEPYLRGGFSFARPQYTLDWENYQGGSGVGGMQVGVLVTSSSDGIMTALARRATGGLPYFIAGNTIAFILVGPDGRM